MQTCKDMSTGKQQKVSVTLQELDDGDMIILNGGPHYRREKAHPVAFVTLLSHCVVWWTAVVAKFLWYMHLTTHGIH